MCRCMQPYNVQVVPQLELCFSLYNLSIPKLSLSANSLYNLFFRRKLNIQDGGEVSSSGGSV